MKKLLFTFFFFLFFQFSKGQLTQGNWLTGGSASFSSTNSNYSNQTMNAKSEEIYLALSPNMGYFLLDKFALGVSPAFTWGKGEFESGITTNTKRFLIGPFARLYLLNTERPFNILTNASYQFGLYSSEGAKGKINTFSVGAGPVIFFNSSVALEVILGYGSRVEDVKGVYKSTQSGFQMGIGFQIHLEKNQN